MQHWLVKTEPDAYSWADFLKEKRALWTGVRNFAARLNLRSMKKGDLVFFYHSVTDKHIVGMGRVVREAFPDPTATEGDWSAVEIVPEKPLPRPVTLDTIKSDKLLKDMPLVKQSRLSVSSVTPAQFARILELGQK